MDGIYGAVSLDGRPLDPGIMASLARRSRLYAWNSASPNAIPTAHAQCGESAALGIVRAGTGNSGALSPWRDPRTGCVIAADARIDNRDELRQQLVDVAVVHDNPSDLQLLLAAYLYWGEGCLQRLLGDYGFGVWDARNCTLFLARDPIGACPLTYVQQRSYFAFGTNPEWLLGLPGVDGKPDALQVAEYLAPSLAIPFTRRSWRTGVSVLLTGEHLRVGDRRKLEVRRWWTPEPVQPESYEDERAVVEHFRCVFAEAVRSRAQQPTRGPAVMMSGGLDSMSLAAGLSDVLAGARRIRTVSVVQDDPTDCIESRSIASLNRSLDSESLLIGIPSMNGPVGLQDLKEIAWRYPHPVDNSLLIPSLVCLAAQRAGERALMFAMAGDLVAGVRHPYFAALMRAGHWGLAWRECRAARDNNVFLRGRSPFRMYAGSVVNAALPEPARRLRSRLAGWARGRKTAPAYLTEALLNKDLLADIRNNSGTADCAEAAERIPMDYSSSAINFGVLNSGMAGFGRVGRKFGLRMSDPWSDLRVIQFFRNAPLEYKVRGGWTKYVVRKAFSGHVDPAVLWRRDKEHLGWRVTRHLMQSTDEVVRAAMNDGLARLSDFVDLNVARKSLDDYSPQVANGAMQRAFELVTLVMWSKPRN